MPLFKKLVVSRALVKECLTLDFRQGSRIPSRCSIPAPTGTMFQRTCDTTALTQEVAKHLQEPVVNSRRVDYYYFEQGQGMIGYNAGLTRILVCTRSAYVGGDLVLRSTRSRADKAVVSPCQGMILVLSPFCAFDVAPVESGSMIVAEISVNIPGFDHIETPAPSDAGVRLFNTHHPLWPRHTSNACFAFRLLLDCRTGERVVEQIFIDGQWYTLLLKPGGGRVCVPADVVGSTHLEEVPFCDVTPEVLSRVLAIDPPYSAVAFARRCTYGAIDVRCAFEHIVYGTFKVDPARKSTHGSSSEADCAAAQSDADAEPAAANLSL
ncbi:hypothetical protein SePPVgORF103 [Seal parapoxvirus]|uniref:Uncharacterized protein n=1 Tax=Seal parapoxvirus TaxID=187984 RepID=A0A1Z3GCQ3_9POXV|nr:hypothetical protein CGV03_gp103 [Seal parapoxvirus]ASC55535.1 hypothetical protein SePPVgORF103 [Seal parapoxvirus]